MKNKTDPQTKIFARLIIFVTMAYIIFVDSTISFNTWMDFGTVMVATCVSTEI